MRTVTKTTGKVITVDDCYALEDSLLLFMDNDAQGNRMVAECPCCEGIGTHRYGDGPYQDKYTCAICAEYGYFFLMRPDTMLVDRNMLQGLY